MHVILFNYLCLVRRNNYFFGFFLGLIIPLLGVVFFYVILYIPKSVSFSGFISLLKNNHRLISSTLSLGLIACIPLFTYYKNRRLYKTLYGVFGAVAIYAIIILGYKLGWF